MTTKPAVLYHTDQATRTRHEILRSRDRYRVRRRARGSFDRPPRGRVADEQDRRIRSLRLQGTTAAGHGRDCQTSFPGAGGTTCASGARKGIFRLNAMLENWLGYVERIVFRGGCFFAAASAEFDSRPGRPGPDCRLDQSMDGRAAGRDYVRPISQGDTTSVKPVQLAFELHAYVQEANWAFKLFNDKSAFPLARRAIASRLASAARGQALKKTLGRRK